LAHVDVDAEHLIAVAKNLQIGNAFGGLSFLAGYPDRPPVTPGSATIPDYMAGIYGAMGVLLALQWWNARTDISDLQIGRAHV
jgi:hypothetical protein